MANQHARLPVKLARQPFGQIDRTVLTAAAADANRQVISIFTDIAGKPGGDKARDVAAHLDDLGFGLKKIDHGRIPPG